MADRREEVAFGLCRLLLAPRYDSVDAVHDGKGNQHEGYLDQVVAGELRVYPVLLVFEERLGRPFLFRDASVLVNRRIALADLVYHYVSQKTRLLAAPHMAGEEDEKEQHNPRDGGSAEPSVAVAVEDAAEHDDPYDAPRRKDEVRLWRERVDNPEVRNEKVDHERGGHCYARDSARHHKAAPRLPRHHDRAERDISIRDARANRRDVDNPADSRAPDERNETRDGYYCENRVARAAVAIKSAERLPEESIPRHRVEETARGDDVADQSRHDRGESGNAENDKPRLAEDLGDGVEHGRCLKAVEYAPSRHIVTPVGEPRRMHRRRDKRKRGVGRSRRGERNHDDAHRPPARKGELLRRMGDRLEADERPWRKRHYRKDLEKRGLAIRKRRGEARHPALVLYENGGDTHRDSYTEYERKKGLDARSKALAAEKHAANNEKRHD